MSLLGKVYLILAMVPTATWLLCVALGVPLGVLASYILVGVFMKVMLLIGWRDINGIVRGAHRA